MRVSGGIRSLSSSPFSLPQNALVRILGTGDSSCANRELRCPLSLGIQMLPASSGSFWREWLLSPHCLRGFLPSGHLESVKSLCPFLSCSILLPGKETESSLLMWFLDMDVILKSTLVYQSLCLWCLVSFPIRLVGHHRSRSQELLPSSQHVTHTCPEAWDAALTF